MGVKVLSVVGTRPEAIKLFPVIHALEADPRFESRVCVTGQHRGMVDNLLSIAEVRPDFRLDAGRNQSSLETLAASLLVGLGQVLEAENPDWVLVQGDTTSALCGALAAFYRKIRIGHVEAGLRTGSLQHPWPEEGNRRLICGIATLHFAPTGTAAAALGRENVVASTIHVTGNTVIDALQWTNKRNNQTSLGGSRLSAIAERAAGRRIVCVTAHRRESFGPGMRAIADAIRQLGARQDILLVLPLHPNPAVRAVMEQSLKGACNVELVEALDYPDFVRLIDLSYLILTDSGGLQEEAPALGKPVLVMRDTTERPEGIRAGTARLVGTDVDRIVDAVTTLLDDAQQYRRMARAHSPFGDGQAATRILEVLASEALPSSCGDADPVATAAQPAPFDQTL